MSMRNFNRKNDKFDHINFPFARNPIGNVNPAGRHRILIVDSSEINRFELKAVLSSLNHDLLEAKTTSEALATISLSKVDLVIMDSAVPEVGSAEFCRLLKRNSITQFLPVFIFASSDDVEGEVSAIEAGADEFLVRPMRPQAVRARIQASLRHKEMIDSLDDSEAILLSLAQSIEERDPGTGLHCQRLATIASAMGVGLGLPEHDILALQRGGYLHDIGKIAVPDNILFKPGPLTSQEWQVMQAHTELGERICAGMRSMEMVLPIIRNHHERWDGSGYPDKLQGEKIPLLARILQIADIYDALTTERPYKPALSSEEAVRILKEESLRGWRDPSLVAVFSDILPTFRTPAFTDLSSTSLHALAASVQKYRKSAGRDLPEVTAATDPELIRYVSGL